MKSHRASLVCHQGLKCAGFSQAVVPSVNQSDVRYCISPSSSPYTSTSVQWSLIELPLVKKCQGSFFSRFEIPLLAPRVTGRRQPLFVVDLGGCTAHLKAGLNIYLMSIYLRNFCSSADMVTSPTSSRIANHQPGLL